MSTEKATLVGDGKIDDAFNAFMLAECKRCAEAGGSFEITTEYRAGWYRKYALTFPDAASMAPKEKAE